MADAGGHGFDFDDFDNGARTEQASSGSKKKGGTPTLFRTQLPQPHRLLRRESSDAEFARELCRVDRSKPHLWRVDRHLPNDVFHCLDSLAGLTAGPLPRPPAARLSQPSALALPQPVVTAPASARAHGRSRSPQRRETYTWGHGELGARMQARIAELSACFRDQIAMQALPITFSLSTSTVGCEDKLRSIVTARTVQKFYVGVTVDPVRRWLGDVGPSRWLGDASRGPMPGHYLPYCHMYLLAVAPRSITLEIEPHLIIFGKRVDANRTRNVAEDPRGQAEGVNFVYVCVKLMRCGCAGHQGNSSALQY